MKIIIYEHIPFSSKVKEVVKEFPSSINVLFIKSPGGRGKATNKDYPLIYGNLFPQNEGVLSRLIVQLVH